MVATVYGHPEPTQAEQTLDEGPSGSYYCSRAFDVLTHVRIYTRGSLTRLGLEFDAQNSSFYDSGCLSSNYHCVFKGTVFDYDQTTVSAILEYDPEYLYYNDQFGYYELNLGFLPIRGAEGVCHILKIESDQTIEQVSEFGYYYDTDERRHMGRHPGRYQIKSYHLTRPTGSANKVAIEKCLPESGQLTNVVSNQSQFNFEVCGSSYINPKVVHHAIDLGFGLNLKRIDTLSVSIDTARDDWWVLSKVTREFILFKCVYYLQSQCLGYNEAMDPLTGRVYLSDLTADHHQYLRNTEPQWQPTFDLVYYNCQIVKELQRPPATIYHYRTPLISLCKASLESQGIAVKPYSDLVKLEDSQIQIPKYIGCGCECDKTDEC